MTGFGSGQAGRKPLHLPDSIHSTAELMVGVEDQLGDAADDSDP